MTNRREVIQPEGNYYDKYHSKNPISRCLMNNFFRTLGSMLDEVQEVQRILEAGCGEGEVTNFVRHKYDADCTITAFDISEKLIKEAARNYQGVNFLEGDIYEIPTGVWDIVICSEVLEHLEYPEKAIQQLYAATNKYLIVSVPREPLWRVLNVMRGKYIRDRGNTPGHIQHWSKNGIKKFLEKNSFNVLQIKSPLPWTMLLLEKRTE